MRTAYRVLAYLIALTVAIQAAAIAYASFATISYVEEGGVLSSASAESGGIPGDAGYAVHALEGQFLVPLLAIALLIVSFFARVPKGPMWAGIVLGTVVVQVALGLFAHGLPALGALHGLLALVLFAVAVVAGYRAGAPSAARAEQPARVV